jgi:hypothetical protein
MLSSVLATLIWVLHMLFVLWVVITPFTNNEPLLVLHLMVMPFIWFHWLVNDDTCALTIMERQLRGVHSNDSFFHNLVSPIYKIEDNDIRAASWIISIALWLITLTKVLQRPGIVRRVFLAQKPPSQ